MPSSGKAVDDAQSEAGASESGSELPPKMLTGIKDQELIKSAKDVDRLGEKCIASAKARARASDNGPAKKSARLHEYEQSHRIGERVWKTDSSGVEAGERASPGIMYEESYQDHLAALSLRGKNADNEKQQEFLEHFARPLKVEWLEKQRGNVNQSPGEPLLDVVHGFPDTGKV